MSADVEVLHDPTPARVRDVLGDLPGGAVDGARHDLVLAVTEVVANARAHGRPPVEVRVGVVDGTVELVVRDRGEGPAAGAPPAGPPPTDATRGRGRWLAHHLADVDERWLPTGFEVRLRGADTGGPREGEG